MRGVRNWQASTRLMHSLCASEGVATLCVVQPIPDRSKPLTDEERAFLKVYPEIVALRARAYEALLGAASELAAVGVPVVSFAEIFESCSRTIYTDLIHFEDEGCRLVAERMAQLVRLRWLDHFAGRQTGCLAGRRTRAGAFLRRWHGRGRPRGLRLGLP